MVLALLDRICVDLPPVPAAAGAASTLLCLHGSGLAPAALVAAAPAGRCSVSFRCCTAVTTALTNFNCGFLFSFLFLPLFFFPATVLDCRKGWEVTEGKEGGRDVREQLIFVSEKKYILCDMGCRVRMGL